MEDKGKEICEKLELNYNDIWNIYPYGSRVYLTNNEDSDYDYIIVYKQSILPSGAFKDNAISSEDRTIQGTCYSRGGFADAINNYQMPALEAIFLSDDMIIKKNFPFKMNKYNENEMIKKVISLSSASWHNAILSYKDNNFSYVDKNIFHALRILDFGYQIKTHRKIVDYSSMNNIKKVLNENEEINKPKDWHNMFIEMSEKLKIK